MYYLIKTNTRYNLYFFFGVLLLNSCSIQKRQYSRGYYVSHYSDKGKRIKNTISQTSKTLGNESATKKTETEHLITTACYVDCVNIDVSISANKHIFSKSQNSLGKHRKAKLIEKLNDVQLKETKNLTSSRNYNWINHKENLVAKEDVKDFLGGLGILLIILLLICLLGFGLQAIFPSLSLAVSMLLGLPTFFILLLLVYIIENLINPHLC